MRPPAHRRHGRTRIATSGDRLSTDCFHVADREHGERLQHVISGAASDQVPLDSLDWHPGASEQRLVTQRAPAPLDLPDQSLIPPRALRYSLAQRLQVEHFAQDQLVGSNAPLPCSVVVLEVHAVADVANVSSDNGRS